MLPTPPDSTIHIRHVCIAEAILVVEAAGTARPSPRSSVRTLPDMRHRRRRSVRWLCLWPPEWIDAVERQALEQVLAADPDGKIGYTLRQRFRRLVAQRGLATLDPWPADAPARSLPSFVELVNGISMIS